MSRMSGISILSYRLEKVTNSYVLHCLWTSKYHSYLHNQMFDWDGIWIKIKYFKLTSDLYWKIKIEYCWHVTYSPWLCHICVFRTYLGNKDLTLCFYFCFIALHLFFLGKWLKDSQLPKNKSRFFTCPCHKMYWVEAVGLSLSNNTFEIMIFLSMWNLG